MWAVHAVHAAYSGVAGAVDLKHALDKHWSDAKVRVFAVEGSTSITGTTGFCHTLYGIEPEDGW